MLWNRLETAFKTLPTIIKSEDHRVRWIGPLMDRGFQVVLEDMGDAAPSALRPITCFM